MHQTQKNMHGAHHVTPITQVSNIWNGIVQLKMNSFMKNLPKHKSTLPTFMIKKNIYDFSQKRRKTLWFHTYLKINLKIQDEGHTIFLST